MSGSARLGLPYLSAGQAGKEAAHNESLQALDLIVAAAVDDEPRNDPPADPAIGACFIVGATPTDAWAGKSDCLAGYTSGGWRLLAPFDGLRAYVKTRGTWAIYRSGAWEIGTLRGDQLLLGGVQVVGGRLGAIAEPAGGATIDSEARAVVGQILEALRAHGLIET